MLDAGFKRRTFLTPSLIPLPLPLPKGERGKGRNTRNRCLLNRNVASRCHPERSAFGAESKDLRPEIISFHLIDPSTTPLGGSAQDDILHASSELNIPAAACHQERLDSTRTTDVDTDRVKERENRTGSNACVKERFSLSPFSFSPFFLPFTPAQPGVSNVRSPPRSPTRYPNCPARAGLKSSRALKSCFRSSVVRVR